jgi:hypothetical protein
MIFQHSRASWQDPKFPITGPRIDWSKIDTVVVHYTADDDLIDGDPGENYDRLPAYHRAMQQSYELNRGYSLGYNVSVDYLGGDWELRGADIKCAANKGHNDHTFAILVLVDGPDPANGFAVSKINNLIWQAEQEANRKLTIIGHGQLAGAATACPGGGLKEQIKAGMFHATAVPPPPPVGGVTVEDDMQVLIPSQRVYDSRDTNKPFAQGEVRAINVGRAVAACAVNVTVVGQQQDGYLTVWGIGDKPATSSVNFARGGTALSNQVITSVDGDLIRVFAQVPCHVIVDVQAVWP